jgi:SAM-dependent methyltransferase
MHSTKVSPQPWDGFSVNYTEKVFSPLQFPHVRQRIIAAVELPRVLDMGCGPTPHLLRDLLMLDGIELFASDFSNKMLETVQRYFSPQAIQFVVGDNRQLPFPNDFFKTVISVNSILPELREDAELMFQQAVRVLRPGGRFVALLPAFETSLMARDDWRMEIQVDVQNHREWDTTGWQCFYTRGDIEATVQRNGLQIIELDKLYLDSEDAIEQIRKIYGYNISSQVLRDYPLFEHFLVARKPVAG